jgi:hypothetical protein
VLPYQQKIYLNQEYPCPCHRQGQLQQIVLTEAFGCNRCQRIFVVQEDGGSIEELATNYLDRRRYYWNGTRWKLLRSLPTSPFWAVLTFRGVLTPGNGWGLCLQGISLVALLLLLFSLCRRLAAASPIFNLGMSMAIATIVLIVTTLWLFNQG